MKKEQIRKVMIYDQGGEAFVQCMGKIQQLLEGQEVEYSRLAFANENPALVADVLEGEVKKAQPDLLIIPATALGEEVAPALGIRLKTGVAAHCSDIRVNEEGRIAYMVPAFGGKVIGEIFIPDAKPAIATVKPGVFSVGTEALADYSDVICETGICAGASAANGADGGLGVEAGGLTLEKVEPYETQKNPIDKASLIFAGGFGIGSAENWQKLEQLAEITGGASGCTRPVVDMGWGPDEQSMIGTSGKTVRPKVYVGFGISGAAHHLCGIKDSDVIVNINSDDTAESFPASDYTVTADAAAVIDALLEKLK